MQITRLRLKNWGIHEKLDVRFGPGINIISGPNGSGKSTILDALQVAVTNDSSSEGSKSDNIMHGRKFAEITADFVHGDTEYQVVRRFGVGPVQRLTFDKQEVTGAAAVNQFLEQLLGCSTEAMLNNVFIRQGAIDNILFSTNSARLKEIQRTVGLNRMSDAERLLGIEVSRTVVTVGLEEQLESNRASLVGARADIDAARSDLERLDAEIERLRPYEETVRRALDAQRTAATVQALRQQVDDLSKRFEQSTADETEAGATFSQLREELVQFEELAVSAEAELARIKTGEETAATYEKLTQELNKALEELARIPELVFAGEGELLEKRREKSELDLVLSGRATMTPTEHMTQLSNQLTAAKERLRDLKMADPDPDRALARRIEDLERAVKAHDLKQCPTCGQSTAALPRPADELQQAISALANAKAEATSSYEGQRAAEQDQVKSLEQRLEEERKALRDSLEAQRDDVQSIIARLESEQTAASNSRRLRDALTSTITAHKARLSGMSIPEFDSNKRASLEGLLDAVRSMRQSESEARTRYEVASSALRSVTGDLEKARRALASVPGLTDVPTDAEVAFAREQLEILSARTQSQRELQGKLGVLEAKLTHYQSTVDRLQEQVNQEAVQSRWAKLCRAARDVLHVSALPSAMMRAYAKVLNQHMAYYLSAWEAEFSFTINDDMEFIAEFPDGRSHSGGRLSGGQKIVGSTSYRFTMCDTFAKQVGLLLLDEPSNYLDKDNIIHLQNLLLKLKALAGASGRQIVLVTHEQQLAGFADHVINLYR